MCVCASYYIYVRMHERTARFYETHKSSMRRTTPRMMLSSSAKRVSTCIIVQTIQTNIYTGLDGWTEMPRKSYLPKSLNRLASVGSPILINSQRSCCFYPSRSIQANVSPRRTWDAFLAEMSTRRPPMPALMGMNSPQVA